MGTEPTGCSTNADFWLFDRPEHADSVFVLGNNLYISHEAYGVGVELDDMPAFRRRSGLQAMADWRRLRPARNHQLPGRQRVSHPCCRKWPGGVGTALRIRRFEKIIIHGGAST